MPLLPGFCLLYKVPYRFSVMQAFAVQLFQRFLVAGQRFDTAGIIGRDDQYLTLSSQALRLFDALVIMLRPQG